MWDDVLGSICTGINSINCDHNGSDDKGNYGSKIDFIFRCKLYGFDLHCLHDDSKYYHTDTHEHRHTHVHTENVTHKFRCARKIRDKNKMRLLNDLN